MVSITTSADSLIAFFEKAGADLKLISQQLEEEFHQRFFSASANPYTLLQRIRKLERDIPAVREECRSLLTAKQELVDNASRTLLSNRALLSQLEGRAGLRSNANEETNQAFRGAIQEWNHKVGLLHSGPSEAVMQTDLNKALVNSVLAARSQ